MCVLEAAQKDGTELELHFLVHPIGEKLCRVSQKMK
jgi:hypothetical protein